MNKLHIAPLVVLALLFSSQPKRQRKGKVGMLRVFNSLQLVGCFAAAPYLLSWLGTNPFPAAGLAWYTACVMYVVLAGILTGCVATSIDKL